MRRRSGTFAGAEPAAEAGGREVGGEELGAIAEEFSGGEPSAARGALHGGGPVCGGPVAGEVEAWPGGALRWAAWVEAGRDGEGGARLFEDAALDQLGAADLGEEAGEFVERGSEDLLCLLYTSRCV